MRDCLFIKEAILSQASFTSINSSSDTNELPLETFSVELSYFHYPSQTAISEILLEDKSFGGKIALNFLLKTCLLVNPFNRHQEALICDFISQRRIRSGSFGSQRVSIGWTQAPCHLQLHDRYCCLSIGRPYGYRCNPRRGCRVTSQNTTNHFLFILVHACDARDYATMSLASTCFLTMNF